MANDKFSQLPSVSSSMMSDIICAVQAGTSVQETMQQVFTLFLSNTILHNAGDPNGSVAGVVYQMCWDTSNSIMYVCTTSGNTSTAVWTEVANSFSAIIDPSHGGTGVADPTAHGIAIAEGSSDFNFLTLTNGQLLIGSTGIDPVPATLSAGTNIAITNGAGSIQVGITGVIGLSNGGTNKALTASAGGIVWSDADSMEILSGTATAGKMLQSGASATPAWSTPTWPSASGTSGQIIVSDGTNNIYSTASFPITAGTAGSIVISNGTDKVNSTSLWTNTVGSSGKILRSDGTINTYSTATFSDTYTASNLLYSNGSNTVTGLATANNGLLVTNSSGVPSVLAGPGSTGRMLQSNAAAAPSFSTATFPSTGGTAGNILISDGTNYISSTSLWPNTVGSAGKILRSDGTTNAYTTATFSDTYSASSLLYSSGANTITGLTTANSATLVTNSSGVPAWTSSMTNGQILIGTTGGTPAPATLTAGGGISISNGAGTITIAGTGSGIGWNEITGTSSTMIADAGYVSNNAGLVTLTLPTTASFGTYIAIVGKGAGGWRIAQNSGQNIQIGSASTTVGVGGTLSSTNRFDSIELLCTTANTTWTVLGGPQSTGLTYV